MFRALARATMLMVVAPSAPVAWWPGAAPLTDSLRRRLPVRTVAPVRRVTTFLAASGREVVAIPVRSAGMCAPWGEPEPIAGVVIHTSPVPTAWLAPAAVGVPVGSVAPTPLVSTPASATRSVVAQTPHRSRGPAAARFRRAAALVVGLLVSLVAVEAAARAGRR